MVKKLGRKRQKIRICQQILWWTFYVGGSYFTFMNVRRNYAKFKNFGSIISERHIGYKDKIFPKITLCPISMHSKSKGPVLHFLLPKF